MSKKKLTGIIISCIVVVALIVVLVRPGVEPALAIVDRVEGTTSVSGEADFSISMADKDEAQVQVLVEDEFTGQPVEGIAVELVVTATTLEVLLHDPQGDYLPGVFVFEQDKLDDYSEIRTENPIIITLLTITVAALKTMGLVKFVAGGVTIMAGGTVPLVKFALTSFVTSLAAGGLWGVTQHMASSASPKDTVNYPITIYVFEEPGGDYATDTIKVQAGTTWEEIDDAVRGLTGDIEVEVTWPAENPAGAYYHPDGTPKVLYVYPVDEEVQDQYNLTISSTAGGSVTGPGEGVFIRKEGTVVSIEATAASGYRFVNWTGDIGMIAGADAASTTITMNGDYEVTANFEAEQPVEPGHTTRIAVGVLHTVGLRSDGTVVAVGENTYGQCDVGDWTDIVQVAAAGWHTMGLKSDGTVVAVGENTTYGECDVGDWTDIVQVAAGAQHTVGLRSDGTVVAVGRFQEGQCSVDRWTDIVQVAAGGLHTVGVKSDGTAVARGYDSYGQRRVGLWTDIVQVAAGSYHTVGLKSDGTVVAVGWDFDGQCDVDDWTDIVQVAASGGYTMGLRSDGTVVAVGKNDYGQCDVGSWTGIIQVAAGGRHSVGLKFDGTVVAVGENTYGQCDVGGWVLN